MQCEETCICSHCLYIADEELELVSACDPQQYLVWYLSIKNITSVDLVRTLKKAEMGDDSLTQHQLIAVLKVE